MSEFDKEAERERLREKFAAEEEERASVQQMGELLLQGMKMTDSHCPECGNPLFSDGERTFCPDCEREVVEGEDEASADGSTQPSQQAQGEQRTVVDTNQGPRANLEAALNRSAAAAAAADDPRDAREHLEAAKAAIEALQALNE